MEGLAPRVRDPSFSIFSDSQREALQRMSVEVIGLMVLIASWVKSVYESRLIFLYPASAPCLIPP